MEWEASLIEWMQAHIGNLEGYVELLAFIGAEAGLLLVILGVMFCWSKSRCFNDPNGSLCNHHVSDHGSISFCISLV